MTYTQYPLFCSVAYVPLSDFGWSNLGISSARISLFWAACKAPWEAEGLGRLVSSRAIKRAALPQRGQTPLLVYPAIGFIIQGQSTTRICLLNTWDQAQTTSFKHGSGGFWCGHGRCWDWSICEYWIYRSTSELDMFMFNLHMLQYF